MNKQRVVSRLQLLNHRVVERILVKEIIVEDEQNVFSILKIFDVDSIPPFEKHFNTRGLKKLKRWMNTSDKAKVLLRYGHSFQQILSDLNKVNEDG